MKKTLTRILCTALAVVTAMMMSINAFASEEPIAKITTMTVSQSDTDGYVLVSREESIDDVSGYLIVDETYVKCEPVTYSNEEPPQTVKRARAVFVNPSSTYGELLFIMWGKELSTGIMRLPLCRVPSGG